MAKKHVTISEQDGVVRIDKFLAAKFSEYSRAAIAKLFTLNLIKRDGIALKPGEKVRPGTKVEYDLGPLQEVPEVIQLPVIYEDEDVVVVDKPAGIISHARGKFWQEASVASFVRDRVKNITGDRAGIVHRLDRATSGVMICAKHEDALKFLQKQFHDRTVTKKYVTIVKGRPETVKAKIIAPIGRNPKNPKQFHITTLGKHAETVYEVKKTENGYSLIELTPATGRTHQLRVHLNHIGFPIVGDILYGGEEYDRLLLHAARLEIMLPDRSNKIFLSPLPKEFKMKLGVK